MPIDFDSKQASTDEDQDQNWSNSIRDVNSTVDVGVLLVQGCGLGLEGSGGEEAGVGDDAKGSNAE